jgi:phenylalanyl-tRNA synthetase alpha chain
MTDQLRQKVEALRASFEAALAAARDAPALQAIRDRFLGRKSGALTDLLKSLGSLAEDVRREAGRELNALKADIEGRLGTARARLEGREREERLVRERLDLTLPGRPPALGRRHPLTVVRQELEDVFLSMGYEVYDGPEVDDDYHCFEALNMPPDHPARDMQDTFYLEGRAGLLRTHTSTGQIRYMLSNPHPPLVRIICPGKVFRRDDDITHSPMFQQVEGLVVGPGISLADLKGTIEAFLHAIFGVQRGIRIKPVAGPAAGNQVDPNVPHPVRFRSSFFPYTEPSVEADLGCIVCSGRGCRVCKQTGWLEILGSGMVHPAVFEAVNARLGRVVYDPEEVTGFAFGLGIERVAMMKHGIDDIRLFYGGDLRFLEQFA